VTDFQHLVTVLSPHEDKLHQLVVDDVRHATSPRSVDCSEGGDDRRG
jgi:hypothetical protein